jgi:hypothetical protein
LPFYITYWALGMVDYGRLAIPAILILAVGGVISFFLALNFYREKHENVTLDGRCYELLDAAHKQYVNLAANRGIETLRLQLSKVESNDTIIPIIFSGKATDIEQFKHKFSLMVTSQHKVKYFPNIDAGVVTANISKSEVQNIVDNLTLKDVYPLSKTVAGSIGIEPNNYITSAEGMDISNKSKEFMSNGVREIVSNLDGLKSAYCRTGVTQGWFVSVVFRLIDCIFYNRALGFQPRLSKCHSQHRKSLSCPVKIIKSLESLLFQTWLNFMTKRSKRECRLEKIIKIHSHR